MLRSRCILLLLYCCGWSIPSATAQFDPEHFVRYSVNDGLTDNAIGCLEQDDRGYIWIGTDEGLNRFDGFGFTSYFEGSAPLNLPSGSIARLKRFSQHQLGILTKGGFVVLDALSMQAKHFTIPDSTAFTTQLNSVVDAEELPDGSFGVTTAAGFYVFDHRSQITFRHDAYSLKDVGQKRIYYGRDILKPDENKLLMYVQESNFASYDNTLKTFQEFNQPGTPWDIFFHPKMNSEIRWIVKKQLSPAEFLFIPHQPDEAWYYNIQTKATVVSQLSIKNVETVSWETKVVELNDSTLLISDRTNGFYVFHIDRKTGHISCDGVKHMGNYKILSMLVDREKRLWVGTTDGLFKQILQPSFIHAYHYPPAPGENFSGGFTCMYRYKDVLYAGRFSSIKGLAVIDARNMHLIREVSFFEGKNNYNEIRSIEMYHPDTLWLGTNGGLLWYAVSSGKYGKLTDSDRYAWADTIYAIMAPPRNDGYAWLCSILDGKVIRYHIPSKTATVFTTNSNPRLPFDRVKSITYDAFGDVWVGGHSLARWNNQIQDFDTLITVYGGKHKFDDNILTISADDSGSLWLHNAYNGLLEYRVKEKKFVPFAMEDGMPSNVIQCLSTVIDHQLWFADNHHLTLFDTETKKFTVFDKEDGLPEQKPTGRQIYYDPVSANFYMGSNEYVVTFPAAIEKQHATGSDLILQEFIVDQDKHVYMPGVEGRLHYTENHVQLYYTIIDFEKSNYQFAYRINDAEKWISLGSDRHLDLNNLPPGKYDIDLRALGKPGFEKTKSFLLIVQTPFWRTPWFFALILLLIATITYLALHRRIRNIRQKANLDKLLSQTEMKALQAQMNPHFIFNSLNSIGEMILNNENQDASHYLSKFARLIRMTLDQSSQQQVSLRNTIDYLERYMEMENIRNNHFTHDVILDPELDVDETFVPPMLIQPFIENALWHGLPANRKDIHVRVEFKRNGDNLVCTITDNGVGIQQAQLNKVESNGRHHSVGIANIKNRVELLNEKYNLHCTVQILDKKEINGSEGSGTVVILQLPLEIKVT